VKDGLVGVKLQNSDIPLKGIKIVELGCGGGILTESLARAGAQVTGIDVSAELINIAKEHVKLDPDISERVNYIQTTVEEFAQKEKETYDALVTCEVLEHVKNPQLFLKVQYYNKNIQFIRYKRYMYMYTCKKYFRYLFTGMRENCETWQIDFCNDDKQNSKIFAVYYYSS